MTKVAVLDDYQGVALQMADWTSLPDDVEVQVFRERLSNANDLVSQLMDFEIVSCMRERTPFGSDILSRLPDLRLLVTTGRGNAAIDLDAATELGIVVCGTDGLGHPTAELTWALILALCRKIPQEVASVRDGGWQTVVGGDLNGKTLGILGLGRLGSRVAAVGRAFEMPLIAWSQNLTADVAAQHGATLVSRDELFARSDVLSIHLVLSDRTRGLVGERELGLMKPTAYLINTARGPIVDEAALLKVLQARSIAGAGLDVFGEEPLPMGHALSRLDNAVLTPHIGYVTVDTYKVFYGKTVEGIAAYLAGQPTRVLNPAALETARGMKR
jgi:phosphoglycerate dehydrogenase-like enzyme